MGRLRPSGNWSSATGVRVSVGMRILIRTMVWPVLVRTAFCSIAHSSGASRLGLVQRAIHPGCCAVASSAWDWVGAGCAAEAGGAAFFLAPCWAYTAPVDNRTAAARATILDC